MTMSRAFLYLVVEKWSPGKWTTGPWVYMVHRINPWRLFFSNKDDQRLQAGEAAAVRARLTRPTVALYPSILNPTMNFALFSRTKDKIVAMDKQGRTMLYDDALRAVSPLPRKSFTYQPVSLAVGDDLFVMTNPPSADDDRPSAEALVDPMYWSPESVEDRVWYPIPTPSYAKPGYDPDGYVWSYTLVGESKVWISAKTHGTYSYDMKMDMWRPEWTKVGDWMLPFDGPAVYAEELDLSLTQNLEWILCAADLQPGPDQPPVVAHEWKTFKVPRGHHGSLPGPFLVHLGAGGRFCIAKFTSNARNQNSVMLTGVEVTRYGDGKADLRLIRHKTYHYVGLGEDDPICVL